LRDLGGDDPVAVAGTGVDRAAEEEEPLSHAREPVAAVDRLQPWALSLLVSGGVEDRERRRAVAEVKSNEDRLVWRVLGGVDQGLLGGAGERQGGVGLARPVTSTVTGVS
jgi:hypothetical protein